MNLIENCSCGKPGAFRVKHSETSRHWRCLGCFRYLVADGPVSVTGYALPKRSQVHDVSLVVESQCLRQLAKEATTA